MPDIFAHKTESMKPKIRLIFKGAIIFHFGCALFISSMVAQEKQDQDLTELSLEELMVLDIFPMNVMGSHIHPKGEWMLGYRYMPMDMTKMREGESHISQEDVLKSFMVTPTRMEMKMHMFEVMYGVTDDLTMMVMVPYKDLAMDHLTRTGKTFTTRSKGVGDIRIMAHYSAFWRDPHRLILMLSAGIPTGNINARDNTPLGDDQRLPYPMQLGYGTFSLIPGITYLAQTEKWIWGGHAMGLFGIGQNDHQYQVGDKIHFMGILTRKITEWLNLTGRLDGHLWNNYSGADPELNPMLIPVADPKKQGGKMVHFQFSFDVYLPQGLLQGNRFSFETGVPVFHDLTGPQMEEHQSFIFVWTTTF